MNRGNGKRRINRRREVRGRMDKGGLKKGEIGRGRRKGKKEGEDWRKTKE